MDKGELVPDELTVRLLLDRVAQDDCKDGYVLDGFPRTIPQAEVLEKELEKTGDKIDKAVNVDVPDENIVRRMSGRRACLKCGATYHIVHIPPKKEGICDVCGSELVLRDDDKEETVKNRLDVYHKQTSPLIDFYSKRNVLETVDGTKDSKEVFEDIKKILK
jgi:adenylate kinase